MADVAVAAEREIGRLGLRPLEPSEAMRGWDHAGRYRAAHVVIAPFGRADVPADPVVAAPEVVERWARMPAADRAAAIEEQICAVLADELGLPAAELDREAPLIDLGMNSVAAMAIRRTMEEVLGSRLSVTVVFSHPTVRQLATHLAARFDEGSAASTAVSTVPSDPLEELLMRAEEHQ